MNENEEMTLTAPTEDTPNEAVEALEPGREELLARIAELEDRILRDENLRAQKKSEISELRRIFPEADPDSLPDEVVRQCEKGVPLCAAFALYEKLRQTELAAADAANQRNARSLNPSVFGENGEAYFSAEEVKRMTPRQVKDNFTSIKRSMKHWANK